MIRILTFSIILLAFFSTCKKKTTGDQKATGPDLIGVFNAELNQLLYLEEAREKVEKALGATIMDTSSTFTYEGNSYNAVPVPTDNLAPFSSGEAGIYQQGERIPLIIRIYWNAECTKVHPGFISPCIGTFGRHRRFGNSMIWTVNNWNSCAKGTSVCLEKLKIVGNIDYFPRPNCMDTIFTRVNIVRFACN